MRIAPENLRDRGGDASPRTRKPSQAQSGTYRFEHALVGHSESLEERRPFFYLLIAGSTAFLGTCEGGISTRKVGKFPALFSAVEALGALDKNWDGYGAEEPKQVALSNARSILEALQDMNLPADRVVPSAEGGVGIYLKHAARYALIECLNDGSITALGSDRRGTIRTWTIVPESREIARVLSEISAYLNG